MWLAQCKLQYLQCINNRDITILHQAIDIYYNSGPPPPLPAKEKIYHKILFTQSNYFCHPVILKFCTEPGSSTAMLCAKFQNDWASVCGLTTYSSIYDRDIFWINFLYCIEAPESYCHLCVLSKYYSVIHWWRENTALKFHTWGPQYHREVAAQCSLNKYGHIQQTTFSNTGKLILMFQISIKLAPWVLIVSKSAMSYDLALPGHQPHVTSDISHLTPSQY